MIAPNLADHEFFIRKAIGWALREYARVDPEWVAEYAHTRDLSPLSRREALTHIDGPVADSIASIRAGPLVLLPIEREST